MFYVTFETPENFNRDVDVYFNNRYQKEWLQDPIVVSIIKDVDKSDLLPNGVVISPVFGAIPITRISGGAKALILMLKVDRIWYGTACGDNCSDWIIKISEMRDITLYFEHPMEFSREFNAVCIDNGRIIHNNLDFSNCYLHSKGFDC